MTTYIIDTQFFSSAACWHEGTEMTDTDRRPSLTVDYMLVGDLSWWLLLSTSRSRLPTANCRLSLLTHLHGAYSAASLAIGPMESCASVDAFKLRPHDTHVIVQSSGVPTGWTGVDMSVPFLLQVAPEIDTNPTSLYRGRGRAVGGSVRLRFGHDSPDPRYRLAFAMSVHSTYLDLATPLVQSVIVQSCNFSQPVSKE